MPTINLYIPREYNETLKKKIKKENISKADYIIELIKKDCKKEVKVNGIS